MTLLKSLHILSLWMFLSIITIAQAAEQTRSIALQVIAKEHIQLQGSAMTSTLTEIKLVDIQQKKRINLGTFGIATGTQANCHIKFTSSNYYRLQQIGKKNNNSTAYKLSYKGKLINKPTEIATKCNEGHSPLTLIPSHKTTAKISEGIYQDKLRIVVTTP